MKYTVNKLALASGVTARTLHHYDEIGLLQPGRQNNGYRYFGEKDLLRLQQILIYRELDVPLATIKKILDDPEFDFERALEEHKKYLESEKGRLSKLVKTIDKTISKLQRGADMNANHMYGGLTKKQMEEYQKEAEERWGNTDAYKQSVTRVNAMGKAGLKKVFDESQGIVKELVALMDQDVASPEVQAVVAKHRSNISHFYDVSDQIYEGLAHMYVDDPRFKDTYDKAVPGLATFLSRAMLASLQK